MGMKANEFLHKKDVAYMNRLSTSLDFDRIVSLMEEYAALRIHSVVGRSEQLRAFKAFLQSEYHLPISNRMVDEFEQKQSS